MAQDYSHKSLLLTSTSRAFGSIQRYIQGPGEIYRIFEALRPVPPIAWIPLFSL